MRLEVYLANDLLGTENEDITCILAHQGWPKFLCLGNCKNTVAIKWVGKTLGGASLVRVFMSEPQFGYI